MFMYYRLIAILCFLLYVKKILKLRLLESCMVGEILMLNCIELPPPNNLTNV